MSWMFVYLLHFEQPVGHAQSDAQRAIYGLAPRSMPYVPHARHYAGLAVDLAERLHQHATGNGSRLMAVVTARGVSWQVSRIWRVRDLEDAKALEHRLKRWHGHGKFCPICDPEGAMRRARFAASYRPGSADDPNR